MLLPDSGSKGSQASPTTQTLFYRTPSLETSSQTEGQAPPQALTHPSGGENKGAAKCQRDGEQEMEKRRVSINQTLKAPDGLQSASHHLASSLLLFRSQRKTSHTGTLKTQSPEMQPVNTLKNAHSAFKKEFCTKSNILFRGLLGRLTPPPRSVPASL